MNAVSERWRDINCSQPSITDNLQTVLQGASDDASATLYVMQVVNTVHGFLPQHSTGGSSRSHSPHS